MAPARHASKSATAFRTISEVAEDIDVPQHVLRFWETKFAQLRPMKRGGGRRYYRPEDVEALRQIKHLLYEEGYTIKGVQKLLRAGVLKTMSAEANAAALDAEQEQAQRQEQRSSIAVKPVEAETEVLEAPSVFTKAPAATSTSSSPSIDQEPKKVPPIQRDELKIIIEELEELQKILHSLR